MRKIPVGVMGASGRMGRSIVGLVETDFSDRCSIGAAVSGHAGSLDDFADVDVIVDFSLPDGTERLCDWLAARDSATPALVCGTTGLTATHFDRLHALGEARAVLHASNYSTGVAAMSAILEVAAPILHALGYEAVLTETHHSGKKDAPSGTARVLQAIVQPDAPQTLQTHSLRAGHVIGEHEIRFLGPDDEITLKHTAQNRGLFARGALDAALWLLQKPDRIGFMTMRDYFHERFQAS